MCQVSVFRHPSVRSARVSKAKAERGPFRRATLTLCTHAQRVVLFMSLLLLQHNRFTETRKTSPDPDTRPHDHWGRYVQMILTTSYVTDLYSPRAPAQQVTVM